MVLDNSLLNAQHYKVLIKGKWRNPGKGVVPSPIPRCIWVILDYSWPTYLYIQKIFITSKSLMTIYIQQILLREIILTSLLSVIRSHYTIILTGLVQYLDF